MAILKLKPSGKDYIWGGHKLVDNYGKEMTDSQKRGNYPVIQMVQALLQMAKMPERH